MTAERRRFEIAAMGRAARAAVAPGRRGSVLAVFRRAFYVELDGGALACIGPAAMGGGPLNALARLPDGLDWRAAGLVAGAPAHVGRGSLTIAGGFELALEPAVEWSPARPADGWSRETLAAGLAALRGAARGFDLADGLARLVVSDAPGGDILIERGRAGAAALRNWIAGDCTTQLSTNIRDLIGLGPGLTPSGDDLMGGAMIALHMLGRADDAAALARWALPIARVGTGKISLALLSCAAEGEGAEALHRAIASSAAADGDAIAAAIAALDGIGHSSGWDALAGAVAAMSAISAR